MTSWDEDALRLLPSELQWFANLDDKISRIRAERQCSPGSMTSRSITLDKLALALDSVFCLLPTMQGVDHRRVRRLSIEAAKTLLEIDGPLHFTRLRYLNLNVARILAKHPGDLFFYSLESFPDSAAAAIAKHKGGLTFYSMKSISPGGAAGLAKREGELSISVESLSIAAAKGFSSHKSRLNILVNRNLSPAAAGALAEHEGELSLRGQSRLGEESGYVALAAKLASQPATLDLSGVGRLSDVAAEALATHRGDLILSGISSGLKRLSDEALEARIDQPRGPLPSDIGFLTDDITISDNALWALAERPGNLDLSGLKDLSDEACEHLAAHQGELKLFGLVSLSEKAIESLARHRGPLLLPEWPQMSEDSFAWTRPASHKFQNLKEAVEKARRRISDG